MTWLFPAVISTFIGSLLLCASYGFLYFTYRKKFLGLWFASWGVYALRYVFLLLILTFGHTPFLYFCSLSMIIVSLFLLQKGTVEFIGKNVPRIWEAGFIVILGWAALAVFAGFSFLVLTVPIFGFFAWVFIWTGYTFLRSKIPATAGKTIVGFTFIVWGLHQADYPFLRPLEWFAPFGFMIGSSCAILIALGMLILFFEQMHAQLVTKKSQLQQMFDAASYGIALANPETGEIIDCNEKFADMLKSEKTAIIGKRQRDLHPAEEYQGDFSRTFKQHLLAQDGQFLESEMLTASGEVIQVEIKANLVDLGEKKYLQGFFRDLSEQRRIEFESNRYKAEFQAIFNSIGDAVVFADLQRRIVRINPVFGRTFGYSQAELAGESAQVLYAHPEEFSLQGELRFNPNAVNQPSVYEMDYRRKDGTSFTGEAVGAHVVDDRGQLLGYLGVIRDVTDRKRYENELLRQQYFLEKAQEMGRIGTWEFDIAKNQVVWTEETYQIFGMAPGSSIDSKSFIERVHPDDRAYVSREWQAALSGRPYDIEHRLLIDGQIKWVRSKADLSFDEKGNPVTAIGFSQEITGRKLAELKKDKLEAELRQAHKMEAIGTLAGGIAHNFNNNLAIIMGNLELAQFRLDQHSEEAECLSHALLAAQRGCDLVRKLMAYSRQGIYDKAPVRIATVVDETLQLLRSTIPSTVELDCRVPRESLELTIQADATLIQELLINLANNAVHAMEEKGLLTIAVDRVALQQSDIPLHWAGTPGSFARLCVEDNGRGMSQAVLEKIFDPFFTTKDIGEGTGVGLSTVKGIVEQHAGLIKVDSTLGQGSRFEVFFPLIEELSEALPAAREGLVAGTGNILLVDDDDMLAKIVALMLKEAGYTVALETSSLSALERIKAAPNHFDLVVTDQTMPKMSGKELVVKIKQFRPELPIILCTGFSSQISQEEADLLGINAFFIKPVEMRGFLQAVREAVN